MEWIIELVLAATLVMFFTVWEAREYTERKKWEQLESELNDRRTAAK